MTSYLLARDNLRRHENHGTHDTKQVWALKPDHPAVIEGRTIFTSTVVNADDAPRLFVQGRNNRKIGDQVQKGDWAGMRIYTLTLEERATCPRSCEQWRSCYGNAMHMARRHRAGPELEARIEKDIAALALKHPEGFVVRLHVLGDFYSHRYAFMWLSLLRNHSQLHIFGYTARVGDEIAATIARMNKHYSSRCFIRTSTPVPAPGSATVVMSDQRVDGAIICPAELSQTQCCSTCGLCWAPSAKDKAILFILHGNVRSRKPRA